MRRLALLLATLAATALALVVPAGALADGDPGSDVLVYQNLFYGGGDGVSTNQANQLTNLLYATTALGAPVRVAIIGQQADLGTVTQLWQNPDQYSWYLGSELDVVYTGRLVVVMPNGAAYFWSGHTNGHETGVPLAVHPGAGAAGLISAASAAVAAVEQQTAGISSARLEAEAHSPSVLKQAEAASAGGTQAAIASTAATSQAGPGQVGAGSRTSTTDVSPAVMVIGLLVVLGAVFWVPPLWRRRRAVTRYGVALPGLTVGVGVLGALAVLAIVTHDSGSSSGQNAAETLATNPDIATPTSLGDSQRAHDFTLTDETGQRVSLSQYRGKVVILSFTDAECQTICPLTTQAMVDARDSLGAAKRDVVLLGVNANSHSTSVQDVLSYTQLHGLLGQWHFLTGTPQQLRRIWDEWGVGEDISSTSRLIEHTPAVYMIGPNGNVRSSFLTIANYASIPQFGQVMAHEAAGLLPSHPTVSTHYSYGQIRGISPTTSTPLPLVGGGHIIAGTAKHLYFFFDSWDQQSTLIKGEMPRLDAYETYARAHGLPTLIAVDEGAVEPNPGAVKTFLAGMHLNYPVAVDTTGRLADGYGVEGEPWFVLTVPSARDTAANPTATEPWEQEVYTQGWPTLSTLTTSIPAALAPAHPISSSAELRRDLAGSSPALRTLHDQAGEILSGGTAALVRRLAQLKGTPVVLNIWASDCGACQSEFGYLASESAQYGSKVAFLGVDYDDIDHTAAVGFLARHQVYYPSYAVTDGTVPAFILPGGVAGMPTTVYFNAKGVRTDIHTGAYVSAQQLGSDVENYALG